jgi:hypothetical protein
VKEYIKKFNSENKGKINLLDFSNYTTKFNNFKDNPISKKDMEVIREFQKRKIDQRVHQLKTQRYGSTHRATQSRRKTREQSSAPWSTTRTPRTTSLPRTMRSKSTSRTSQTGPRSKCPNSRAGSTSTTSS